MNSTTAVRSRSNPYSGTLLLMATILASELAMLNIIFWARAQGTIAGLAIATIWPWVVAFSAPLLWSTYQLHFGLHRATGHTIRPGLATALGLALVAAVLAGRLTLFA
ncbi:MAG: hypothetical protein ABL994_21585 [Verrucomicrobiales bacterium]